MATTNTTTLQQGKVLQFIAAYIEHHGYPPSIREISRGIDLSRSTAHLHLMRLSDEGYIRRRRRTARGLRLTEKGERWLGLNA